jgi:hypothetical protein
MLSQIQYLGKVRALLKSSADESDLKGSRFWCLGTRSRTAHWPSQGAHQGGPCPLALADPLLVALACGDPKTETEGGLWHPDVNTWRSQVCGERSSC